MNKNEKELTPLQIVTIRAIMSASDKEVEQAMKLFQEHHRNGANDETT